MQEIFNEKYRPQKFDEVVGLDPEIPKLISKDMPHLLFTGPPGTGKTTVARIVARELDADLLMLNASNDRGIDTIREKIEPFAKKASDKLKIVFLDEFDATTPAFQTALRNFMEVYSGNTRFICTCNYINKIIPPLISRFSVFEFNRYDAVKIREHLETIIIKEKININQEALTLLVKRYKDDIRGMINFLNKYKDKEITPADLSNENTVLMILKDLADGKWLQVRERLLEDNADYGQLIEEIDQIVFLHKGLSMEKKIRINKACAEYSFKMYFVLNKELCFAALLAEIQEALK